MSVAYQAVNIRAPQGDGVNPTDVLHFTCTNSSKSNAIPASWAGKYIYIYNEGAVDADFFFSQNASATIADAPAATDAGAAAATQGGRCRANGERHVRVPSAREGVTTYFLRYSASATTLRLERSSD
jgi:hypothetical protein